ncbi:MAG: ATP-binding protein [Pseudomonadota bacterium]
MEDVPGNTVFTEVRDSRFSGDATLEELQIAVENAMTGISWLDTEGIFRQVRDGYAAMLGYTPAEMIGSSWAVTVPESDQPTAVDAVHKMLDDGRATVETRAIRKDGTIFYKRLLLVKTVDAGGRHNGHYCFMSDISARKEAQRRLVDAERLKTIGTMAGGIAHDLNNLLTPIVGGAELIAATHCTHEAPARSIREAAARAQELIARLLKFSSAEREQKKPVNLSNAVRVALQFVSGSLPANVAVEAEYSADADTVLGLEVSLELIVMNLVANAGHAMRDAGGTLFVALRNVSPAEVELVVTDTGSGIAAERIDRIFEAFYTTKSPAEGTGLGLLMVREAVEDMGGRISVTSTEGEGAEFRVVLPVSDASTEPDEKHNAHETPSLRIMVIDDEKPVLDVCCGMLEHLGHQVDGFTDPTKALAEPLADYDLVITDYRIGGVSGLDVIEQLEGYSGPIILISGHIDSSQTLPDKVTACLPKPFRILDLQEAIHGVTRGREAG